MDTPKYTAKYAEAIARHYGILDGLCFIGIRGYYEDTMGERDINDLGIYDDALLITPMNNGVIDERHYRTLSFNTDPSKYVGRIASLALSSEWSSHFIKPRPYYFIQGIHAGSLAKYEAYREYGDMLVHRANGVSEVGYFWINFHKGGAQNTSSLACQTVPTHIWNDPKYFVRTPTESMNFLKYLDFLASNNPSLPQKRTEQLQSGGKSSREKRIVPYILLSKQEADAFESGAIGYEYTQEESDPTPQPQIKYAPPTTTQVVIDPNLVPTTTHIYVDPPTIESIPNIVETQPNVVIAQPDTEIPVLPVPQNKWRNALGWLFSLLGVGQIVSDSTGIPMDAIEQISKFISQNIPEKFFKYAFVAAILVYGFKLIAPNSFIQRAKAAYNAFKKNDSTL